MKKTFLIPAMITALTVAAPALASPGDLDSSFGGGGKTTTDFSGQTDLGFVIAVQDDGKILAAGNTETSDARHIALARYNADGSPDATFGSSGEVFTDFSGNDTSQDDPEALFVRGDGGLLLPVTTDVAGSSDIGLALYDSAGHLDASFGSGGLVTTDFSGGGSSDSARDAAMQADGKIVVVGFSDAAGTVDFALVRYNTDGSPDSGFGSKGLVTTDFAGREDAGEAVAIQADGKIVVGGSAQTVSSLARDFALVRYKSDGSLDDAFGSGGKATAGLTGDDNLIQSIAVQADGKIVAGGHADDGDLMQTALVRFNADGTLDTSFGTGGKVVTDVSAGQDEIGSVLLQSDGKILVVGSIKPADSFDGFVARYNPDGSLDTGFGNGGIGTQDFSGANVDDFLIAGVLRSDGALTVVGSSGTFPNEDFLVARFLGDPPPAGGATSGADSTPAMPPNPDAASGGCSLVRENVP